MERTIDDEIADVRMGRPHVVILGAGASRAACPKGDRDGQPLPLMCDFSQLLGLAGALTSWGLDPSANFEDTYSSLHEAGESEKIAFLNQAVVEYFTALNLPDHPTVYDHLVLSLRSNDIIATFNWDPFLIQACLRNSRAGLSVPRLAFLHGNVLSGFCAEHTTFGVNGNVCSRCRRPLKPTPLLYPIGQKRYSDDESISAQWSLLRSGLSDAFMITVFGYGAPKSDMEAVSLMREAWGDLDSRNLEQTEFITRDAEAVIKETWRDFIFSHHYDVTDDFYKSWIANHPRRTGEAYISQYLDAKFITDNPIPRDLDFEELWKWFSRFHDAEVRYASS